MGYGKARRGRGNLGKTPISSRLPRNLRKSFAPFHLEAVVSPFTTLCRLWRRHRVLFIRRERA